MNRKDNTEMFKCLAAYVLPEGILSYFDITDITEEEPKDPKIKSFDTDLHIYLDERDNRPKDMWMLQGAMASQRRDRYWTSPYVVTRP